MVVKLNGNLKIISVLMGVIGILVTIFIFVLRSNNVSAQRDNRKQDRKIEHTTEDVTTLKVRHSRFEAKQEDMSEDISEIKSDVKTLLAR